jgi:hypothetical protein
VNNKNLTIRSDMHILGAGKMAADLIILILLFVKKQRCKNATAAHQDNPNNFDC